MITENLRAVRMIEDTPEYYHYSKVYNAIQQANAEELDLLDLKNTDLALQLDPKRATWGLSFWEERLGLLTNEADSMEKRRKKVLARIRSGAPFSGAMIKAVVEAYTARPVKIEFDIAAGEVKVIMDAETNIDPELFTAVENIIHAHLGIEYRAEWVYSSGWEASSAYSTEMYEFQAFAATDQYAGILYDGGLIVPDDQAVTYEGGEEISTTYEKAQQDSYRFAAADTYAGE